MGRQKRNFDKEASSWDKPGRIALSNDVATALMEEIRLGPGMDVLDFGCGTGLLSLRLQPFVHTLTCVDNSQGMLEVLKAKIEDRNLTNVRVRHLDLDAGDTIEGCYDLIVSSMTIHHIPKIRPLPDRFSEITAMGGYLCIADLDPDDGRFHSDNNGVFHYGIDRADLRRMFADAGFGDIRDRTAAEVIKPAPDGGTMPFTVFLMTGRKNTRPRAQGKHIR